MKKLLLSVAFGTSLSAWAVDPQLNCQALVSSQGIVNSDSAFKNELSQIVTATVPALYNDLKIKINWGESGNVDYLFIKKDEPATHQSIPRIPDPSAWSKPGTFTFTVVVLGTSSKAIGSSIKRYRIHSYTRSGKTLHSLSVEASEGSQLRNFHVDLLNLYVALTAAPFVDGVIIEQDISPTKMGYPDAPIALAEPAELRAIRSFRQVGGDRNKREEAAQEIKPGIVNALESGRSLEYQGLLLTGFSDQLEVVSDAKAVSFTVEYVFKVPSTRR